MTDSFKPTLAIVFISVSQDIKGISNLFDAKNIMSDLPVIEELHQFKPKVSIGIKSGEMISGNMGSGNLRRLDYTVIGDTVNTAARLQDVAKENQIIICESCYNKVKEAFKCTKIGSIPLKNKADQITVYEVLE